MINDGSHHDPREERANKYAAEILIPAKYNMIIPTLRSRTEVLQLAAELGIASGIVVGRYQHLTGKWDFFKDLIRPLQWI